MPCEWNGEVMCLKGHVPGTRHCYHAKLGCRAVLITNPEDWESREGFPEKALREDKRQGWVLTNYYQYTCPACFPTVNPDPKAPTRRF